MITKTDHRIVITEMENIPIKSRRKNNRNEKKHDLDKLKILEYNDQFKEVQHRKIYERESTSNPQEKWNNIVKSTNEAAEEVLDLRKNGSRYSVNPRIKELSILQRKLQTQINNSNTEKCKTLRHERNKLLNKMHRLLEDEKHNKVIRNLEEVEKRHDNACKMYAAVRILQRKRKKIPLLIDTKNELRHTRKRKLK